MILCHGESEKLFARKLAVHKQGLLTLLTAVGKKLAAVSY